MGVGIVAARATRKSCQSLDGTADCVAPREQNTRPPARGSITVQASFQASLQTRRCWKEVDRAPRGGASAKQEFLHAIIRCLTAGEADDTPKTRQHHAAVMIRFEEALEMHIDQKLNMPALCAEIGVPERTLGMCCGEFLGVSPIRYLWLRRLNRARSALRRADPTTASVTQIARNHQFLELGRFATRYLTTLDARARSAAAVIDATAEIA